jgi:hypothetical protein
LLAEVDTESELEAPTDRDGEELVEHDDDALIDADAPLLADADDDRLADALEERDMLIDADTDVDAMKQHMLMVHVSAVHCVVALFFRSVCVAAGHEIDEQKG